MRACERGGRSTLHLHKQPVFGARKSLQRDFDADAGSVELHPQEITRACARRRRGVRLRGDTHGLREELGKRSGSSHSRQRQWHPGRCAKRCSAAPTTKPAGERTGLGLSMTDDIIAKQHGGRIDVLQRPNHVVLRNLLSRCRERQSCKRHPLARIDYAHSGSR